MKSIIKKSFFALCALVMFPFTLLYLMLSIVVNKDSLLSSFSQLLSLIPGKLGCYLRSGFYRFVMTSCAPNVLIGFATLFSQQDTEIDEGVYIGPQCNIGKCAIGKNTLLGSGVHIMSGKGQPDYTRCIQISTTAALKEMIAPGLLVILSPLVFGSLFISRLQIPKKPENNLRLDQTLHRQKLALSSFRWFGLCLVVP